MFWNLHSWIALWESFTSNRGLSHAITGNNQKDAGILWSVPFTNNKYKCSRLFTWRSNWVQLLHQSKEIKLFSIFFSAKLFFPLQVNTTKWPNCWTLVLLVYLFPQATSCIFGWHSEQHCAIRLTVIPTFVKSVSSVRLWSLLRSHRLFGGFGDTEIQSSDKLYDSVRLMMMPSWKTCRLCICMLDHVTCMAGTLLMVMMILDIKNKC